MVPVIEKTKPLLHLNDWVFRSDGRLSLWTVFPNTILDNGSLYTCASWVLFSWTIVLAYQNKSTTGNTSSELSCRSKSACVALRNSTCTASSTVIACFKKYQPTQAWSSMVRDKPTLHVKSSRVCSNLHRMKTVELCNQFHLPFSIQNLHHVNSLIMRLVMLKSEL